MFSISRLMLCLLALMLTVSVSHAEVIRLRLASASQTSGCTSCQAATSNCQSCTTCPQCHAHCELEVKKGEEKKSCFQVECKTICIPKIRFPWQSCCEPVCAQAKTVKVLKQHSYTCPKCEYTWKVVEGSRSCAEPAHDSNDAAPTPPPAAAAFRSLSSGKASR